MPRTKSSQAAPPVVDASAPAVSVWASHNRLLAVKKAYSPEAHLLMPRSFVARLEDDSYFQVESPSAESLLVLENETEASLLIVCFLGMASGFGGTTRWTLFTACLRTHMRCFTSAKMSLCFASSCQKFTTERWQDFLTKAPAALVLQSSGPCPQAKCHSPNPNH